MEPLKFCFHCKRQLSIALFNRKKSTKDGLQNWCKQCHRDEQNKYYKRNDAYKARVKRSAIQTLNIKRDKLLAVLRTKHCVTCGEKDPIVLEFDHIDPTIKKNNVGSMLSYPWATIEAEIAKCQVLCANCHRRKTAKDRNWWKLTHEIKEGDKA